MKLSQRALCLSDLYILKELPPVIKDQFHVSSLDISSVATAFNLILIFKKAFAYVCLFHRIIRHFNESKSTEQKTQKMSPS